MKKTISTATLGAMGLMACLGFDICSSPILSAFLQDSC